MFIKSLLFSDCQNVIKVQYRNLLKKQKSQFVLLRDCCYISDSQGVGVWWFRRTAVFLCAGTIVVSSLYLTRCLQRVSGCLQACACVGCYAWRNPNPQEPGGGEPHRAAVCGRRILFAFPCSLGI